MHLADAFTKAYYIAFKVYILLVHAYHDPLFELQKNGPTYNFCPSDDEMRGENLKDLL